MNPRLARFVAALSVLVIAANAHAQPKLGTVSVIIQAESGKPVTGATVQCVNWDDSCPRTEPLAPREQAVSDANGRASFEGVTIGQAFVRVVSGNLGGWFRVQDRSTDVPLKIGVGHSTLVVVRDQSGKPIPEVVALADGCIPIGNTDHDGQITLRNHGIGYTPTLYFTKPGYGWERAGLPFNPEKIIVTMKPGVTIEGVVLAPDGKPVSDAEIWWGGQQKVVSNATGEFRFPDVAAGLQLGKLMVYATKQSPPLLGELASVSTTPPVEKLRITLRPAPTQRQPRPGVTFHGKVVHSETGKPVMAKVLLDYSDRFEFPRKRVKTDSEGRFTFESIEGDWVWLYAAPVEPTLYAVGGAVRVKVADATSNEVTLKAADGCAIRGRVVTEDGKPAVRTQVMFNPMTPFYRAIWTDEQGYFSIPSLDGVGITYKVSVSDRLQRQASVDVGPMKKGELRNDIELHMPKAIVPAALRGIVVDSDGKPVPNVNLNFIYGERSKEPSLLSASSDDRGAFSVPIARSGKVTTNANRLTQLDPAQHISAECPVLEGGAIDLTEGTDKEVRIVVRPEPLRVLTFTVVDEQGKPIHAEARFVYGDYREDSVQPRGDGSFSAQRFPKDPYVLEVTAPQYQARVLFKDTDFKEGDENLTITLKKGPFPFGVSIWEAVTGRPSTEEAVDAAGPLADIVRKRERKYFCDALPPRQPQPAPAAEAPKPPSPSAAPARDYSHVMRVVDAAGKPVQRVLIEQLYMPDFDKVALLPPRAGAQQPKSAEDGVYPIPEGQGCVVSSPGLARVPVSRWTTITTEPRTIVLEEPCSVELQITGADGKPAADVPISLPQAAWEGPINEAYTLLLKTDAQGHATFTDIAPGPHRFAVGVFKQNMQLITVNVKPKDHSTVTVKLDDRQNTQNPLALMQVWREARRPQPKYPSPKDDVWIAEIQALPKATQQALEKEVMNSLAVLRPATVRSRSGEQGTKLLLGLASALGSHDIANDLRDIFTRVPRETTRMPLLSRSLDARIASTIADIEANKSAAFFEKAAANTQLSHGKRLAALLALGQLHTGESAAAYARLRNAAYSIPGAPERRASYTHAERMTEAAMMTLYIIPGEPLPQNTKGLPQSAFVAEDYQSATLQWNRLNLRFARVGSEWLVSSAEMGPVS